MTFPKTQTCPAVPKSKGESSGVERLVTVFGEALHHIIHVGQWMTIQQVADAWALEVKSVYYYMDAWPGLDKVLQLLRVAPPEAQEHLLALILRYAPGWNAIHTDATLDLNGDGDINIDDLLAATVNQVAASSESLKETVAALADGDLSHEEVEQLSQATAQGRRALAQYQLILEHLVQHKMVSRRRKAKVSGAPLYKTGATR